MAGQAVSAPSEMKLRGKLQPCPGLEPRTYACEPDGQLLSRADWRCPEAELIHLSQVTYMHLLTFSYQCCCTKVK